MAKQGPVAAEEIVRRYPERFKSVRASLSNLTKRTLEFAKDHDLEQKKALVLELWRVRSSLNILGLLQPDLLHQLTGIDAKTLKAMQGQFNAAWTRVNRAQ